jgi:hypothetical protein
MFWPPAEDVPAEWDDFGYRFEPGRKYVIGDASDIGGTGKISRNAYRIWLYNAMSTEMSLNLLKIPGKNTDLSKDYADWLSKKRKLDPAGLKYKDYKWPLDIIGIQKHSYQPRGTRMPDGVLIKLVQELRIYDTSNSNSTTGNSII